jgi:hypothetical protein
MKIATATTIFNLQYRPSGEHPWLDLWVNLVIPRDKNLQRLEGD